MKKYAPIYFLLLAFVLFTGCNGNSNSSDNQDNEEVQQEEVTEENTSSSETEESPAETASTFDINAIPVSTADIGDFPFFSFPTDLEAQDKPMQRAFDEIYFPIDGTFVPLEGKSWKTDVVNAENSQNDWSLPYFLKSYDKAITAVGGVKIYDGKVSREELDRIEDKAKYFGEDGSIDYWNEPVRTYLIRRPNGNDVYIQISGNTAAGAIQILQEEAFEQTITKVTSDKIVKDLNETGKSILYINFDVDKADIKTDGKEVVDQITKALQQDASLNISIEGHTDNTGDAAHNKKLSDDRAKSVMNALVSGGIDKSRLTAQGFGAEKPLVANDSEENKAKNRRVELVKK